MELPPNFIVTAMFSPLAQPPKEWKMAKERNKAPDDENGAPSKQDEEHESKSGSESDNDSRRSKGSRHSRRDRNKRKRRREDEEDSYTSSSESESYSDAYSDSGSGSSEEYSEPEEDRRRRRRKERRKREEREREREKEKRRRRMREKEKKKRRKEREEQEEKKRKKHKEKKKKRDKEKGKKGAVTNSWGKYGIIRETDMWIKRPEFTAWLAEVKQVNLESLPNWEEKQMFKEFMEDHNTATFPSKKYYNLDAYQRRKMEKEMKRGPRKVLETERIIFNDEEQRRQELLVERERQKELQVEALKRSMQGGLAQAMKEQAQLKEEMAYQYKIGNFEAAAAIQRRLDPDLPM